MDKVTNALLLTLIVNTGSVVCSECSANEDPVIGMCTSSQTFHDTKFTYLDTGTAPLQQESRCRCEIVAFNGTTILSFHTGDDADWGTQVVKAGDLTLNSSSKEGEITLTNKADIWLFTNGSNGVCISVTSSGSGQELLSFNITCFASQAEPNVMTGAEGTSKLPNITTSSTMKPTATATVKSITICIMTGTTTIQFVTSDDTATAIIIGSVAGGVTCVAIVVLVACIVFYRKKSERSRKGDSHEVRRKPAEEDSDIEMTENPMYEKSDAHYYTQCNNSATKEIMSEQETLLHKGDGVKSEKHRNKMAEYDFATKFDSSAGRPREIKHSESAVKFPENQYDHIEYPQPTTSCDDYHHLSSLPGEAATYDRVK